MSAGPQEAWATERLERWRTNHDKDALGELLKWQRDRACAVALRILNRPAEAEDAVQQAFMKMFARAPKFESADEFQAAVYRMVTQASIDLLRAGQSRQKMEKAMALATASVHADVLENAEINTALREELEDLKPEDRALLALCVQEGQSLSVAAGALDMRRETARDRLRRLLTQLRGKLSNRGISLSLLLLVGLIQEGRTAMASEGLCQGLNTALPGAACKTIAPAAAAKISAGAIIAQAGLTTSLASTLVAGIVAVGMLSAGLFLWNGQTPKPSTQATSVRPPVSPPNLPVVAPPVEKVAAPAKALVEKKEDQNEEVEDEKVPLEQVPALVRQRAEAAIPQWQLLSAEKSTEKGLIIYELEGRANGKRYEIRIDANGKVLEKKAEKGRDRKEAHGEKPAVPLAPAGEF